MQTEDMLRNFVCKILFWKPKRFFCNRKTILCSLCLISFYFSHWCEICWILKLEKFNMVQISKNTAGLSAFQCRFGCVTEFTLTFSAVNSLHFSIQSSSNIYCSKSQFSLYFKAGITKSLCHFFNTYFCT